MRAAASPPRAVATRILVPASPGIRLSMFSSEVPNAAGLSSQESKALPERQPSQAELKIIAALKELYSCNPRESTYDVYTKSAIFQDPISIAEGVGSIKSQFNGLAKLFPRADIIKFHILKNPENALPGIILVDQDVAYYRDPSTSSPTKTLNSLLTLHTDAEQRITRHTEEWNHKHDTLNDGFFGMLNEYRKKMTASLTDNIVSKDPPKKD
ncbi:hypothetical protein EW145_g569 [Phellinidium pouzarii]|uniref:Uncharacterized protein n=1 Tax=Phellinidium pouzarii TaxID=167371 RepID=A0A4S4LIK4_9AGAM|nr:hypothetical protein EW145_g569 [Phellinidium pouzarii]